MYHILYIKTGILFSFPSGNQIKAPERLLGAPKEVLGSL
jgi:hypothetical protein